MEFLWRAMKKMINFATTQHRLTLKTIILMKKSLFVLALLAMGLTVHAAITPTDSQMWWGYFSESDSGNLPYDGNLGYSSASTISAAIRIPAGEEYVDGSTIKAVRLWLGDNVTAISSSMKVWVSSQLPDNVAALNNVQEVAKSQLVRGVNEIVLKSPYKVSGQDTYVGFTFDIGSKAYPVMSYGQDEPNAFYYRVNSNAWEDIYGYDYGKLALQVLIEGRTYPTVAAVAADFGQHVLMVGERTRIPITITNKGKNAITEISYTLSIDGGSTTAEDTRTLSSVAYNGFQTTYITLDAGSEAKKSVATLTITKVNGQENHATKKSATGSLITIVNKPAVTPAIEEFTGTWCGWCPYGIVGMQKAHEAFGDQVVLIAAHSGDVMETEGYAPILNGVKNFPGSKVNRAMDVYPTANNLLGEVIFAKDSATQGEIALKATWNGKDKTAVKFITTTKFAYADNDARYGIAFVLVEDGMKGSGSQWAQNNNLSGGSGDSDMTFWYNAGSPVSGIEYDHVAVEGWGILNGVEGSVATSFQAGQELRFSYEGDIASNQLIQDKSKLKAVALLIDQVTGRIVNAAQATVTEASAVANDVNGDGEVNVGDIMAIINIMAGTSGEMDKDAADVNGDNKVDVGDIMAIINIMAAGSQPVDYYTCPDDNHPHWIDLGLPSGTQWRCCNEGTDYPCDYGYYYTFEEASSAPTLDQMNELIDNCTSVKITKNEYTPNGRMFIGPNGKAIFLPAAGFEDIPKGYYHQGVAGSYWTSTPYKENYGYALYFFNGQMQVYGGNERNAHRSVRSVR